MSLDGKIDIKSKVGSLDNINHTPGGGQKKIFNAKIDFKSKASSKVGSTEKLNHTPGGGRVWQAGLLLFAANLTLPNYTI